MYRFDPEALHLAREFRARPIGQHSPALERLLTLMRGGPMAGKYCLVATKPHQEWVVAQLSGVRGVGPTLLGDQVFHSVEDAEWAVFKLRWKALGGAEIDDARL